MERYKPGYMGKIMPADDPAKLLSFVNKYDAFTKFYDACKNVSEKIVDIKMVENNSSDSIVVKIVTDTNTIASITEACKTDPNVTVSDCVITAKG